MIEMITAVFVFSIIMVTTGTIFVHALGLQRRGFGAQKIQENGLFVLETMAREIRVSTIQSIDNDCNTGSLTSTLSITHPVNGAIQYTLNGGVVIRTVSGLPTKISTDDVQFVKLYFCIQGSGIDDQQTRVAILATVENISTTPQDKVSMTIQTMVSSREVSTEFQN